MTNLEFLNSFYQNFIDFRTEDGSNNINPSNTNFDIIDWIDELKEELYKNDFAIVEEVIKDLNKTPYLEFEYSWNYLKEELLRNQKHMNFEDRVNAAGPDYYELQTTFTFIFSLLNRLTMLHYISTNTDYFYNLIEEELSKDEQANISKIIRNKLKRVTFSNWRYNPLITQFENSFLWSVFLKEARNVDEHYGVLFKIENPKAFEETTFNFYTEIMLSVYLFLFYLGTYKTEYLNFDDEFKEGFF